MCWFPPARRPGEGVVGVRGHGRGLQGAAEVEQGPGGPAPCHGGGQPPGVQSTAEEHRESPLEEVGRDQGVE